MVKKILITGSNGFVGKNLIEYYSDKYSIITLFRNDNIDDKLAENPDFIINTAASIYDFDTMFDTNVRLVHKLIEYVKQTKTRLLQIGSSAEYGKKDFPSKETDLLEPVSYYAGTKAAATLMCQSVALEYDLPIVVARPYSLYGKYEKTYRLFSKLYESFVNNTEMTLSEGYHDLIYIDDFIFGLDLLLHNGYNGDIVNFGTGRQTSNFEVLNIFVNIFGNQPNCIKISQGLAKPFENNTWLCDIKYAKEKYGFVPRFSIKQGVQDLITQRKTHDSRYDRQQSHTCTN